MMHGNGKSDPAIVAVKPANKAERSAAELVERRAGTKGNADQQSTRRAQDRVSVSQALGRIRQAARQRKKEKFTSLFHHISVELLRLSFFELKKDAAPGVDGMTWQDYELDLDHKIEDLRARVRGGNVSGAAKSATLSTKAGWPTASNCDRRSRGQDRPESDHRGAERDLRGGFPRVLVRVPPSARPARCAGRLGRRDHQQKSELDTRGRRPQFL